MPALSNRGRKLFGHEQQESMQLRKIAQGNSYDPISNPTGFVLLSLAENSLLQGELAKYFQAQFKLEPLDFTYGDGLSGTKRLSRALCDFFNDRFAPITPVKPDHLITGAGLTDVLNQLFQVLTDPGDGVILASPHYPGFDYDLQVQNDAIPIPVPVPKKDRFSATEVDHLEKALIAAKDRGVTVRAVILCNPHNPIGQCYTRDAIIYYAKFCEKHDLQLLSDEIYAFSVFPTKDVPNPEPFVSALSIDWDEHGIQKSRIHVLYGMSKDFNANGFRIGCLISQHNPELFRALELISFIMIVSSPASALWTNLLNDKEYCTSFIEKNQTALREAYEFFTDFLKFHETSYEPSNAGPFMMVDMRKTMQDVEKYGAWPDDTNMVAREMALTKYLAMNGVIINPGIACHADEPGWMRVTFATRRDHMEVGLRRIEDAFGWERWDRLKVKGAEPDLPRVY